MLMLSRSKKYTFNKKRANSGRIFILLAVSIVFIALVVVATLRIWYANNLRPVSDNSRIVYFSVEQGNSKHQIALNLYGRGLIRNSKAFETYLRSNEVDILQAGTYSLSPSMNVKTIVDKMAKGDVTKNLFTILPSKRLAETKQAFAKAGYSQTEIDQAFNPATYTDAPVLKYVPSGASLEGFLYPDSFQKTAGTPASTIVRESLDEMQEYLTPEVINNFAARGLSVYQGITLASIVNQETDDPTYQPTVAQVFLTRLKQGMRLQSNVTANYAADEADVPRNVNIASPYNTYLHDGLPPGPIGNFTDSALKAVAHPSNTDFVYFIAGDDKKMHFTHTAEEHAAAIKQYCTKLCAQ
jgi:UPF0755 protein